MTDAIAPGLVPARMCTSCILAAGIEPCWDQIRDFGRFSSWMKMIVMAGTPCPVASYMMGGACGCTVGAVRAIEFGPNRLLEQLDALDDNKHVLKFHILSHPSNLNPFPGSYVNSRTEMSMQPISMGNQTRFECDTNYLTEPENLEAMQTTFQVFQETILQNLQQWALSLGHLGSGGSKGPSLAAIQVVLFYRQAPTAGLKSSGERPYTQLHGLQAASRRLLCSRTQVMQEAPAGRPPFLSIQTAENVLKPGKQREGGR
ncbi:hypothetical protein WJX84_011695 [Apatococcus fuscideae]|uniref:Uncharacterized protein n=1 Tax=Apatococcus fuscideae TaxID=2026836 RepID=A0AAW1TAE1_9CHLO